MVAPIAFPTFLEERARILVRARSHHVERGLASLAMALHSPSHLMRSGLDPKDGGGR